MEQVKTVRTFDLGTFDDVYTDGALAHAVARKGNDWFTLSPGPAPEFKKLATLRDTSDAHILGGIGVGTRRWVFVEAGQRRSFVLDAQTADVVEFAVPGVEPPGRLGTQIQSWVIARGIPAAVFMISGGERWPRDGNRPLYYWMDLASGKLQRAPVGWDLDSLSPDQKIALFSNGTQALDMTTGQATDKRPDPEQGLLRFNWSDKPLIRLVRTRTDDAIRGFSIDGKVYPLKEPSTGSRSDNARTDGQWIAWGGGEFDMNAANRLFLASLNSLERARPIADHVMDHAMLGKGSVLLSRRILSSPGDSESDALVYQASDQHAWNPLDGIPDLPPLPPELADQGITDSRRVRLIRSADGPGPALCIIEHDRVNYRASAIPLPTKFEPQLERWVFLLTPGHRYMTDLFAAGVPDAWLDPSGQWVITRQTTGAVQAIQLSTP
jgi:hypothetical protein